MGSVAGFWAGVRYTCNDLQSIGDQHWHLKDALFSSDMYVQSDIADCSHPGIHGHRAAAQYTSGVTEHIQTGGRPPLQGNLELVSHNRGTGYQDN